MMTDYTDFVAYLDSIGGNIDNLNNEYLKRFEGEGIEEGTEYLKGFLLEIDSLLNDPAFNGINPINKRVAKVWIYYVNEAACCEQQIVPKKLGNNTVGICIASALTHDYQNCCYNGCKKW